MKKCVFLDRDGTINVEKDYLHKIEDFEWEYRAKEAIKIIKNKGYIVIVVTNQSGVARGYYDEEAVKKLHKYMNEELKVCQSEIDAFYYCPHHKDGVGKYKKNCDCRKPELGMFEEAFKEFDIDLGKSYIVGDKRSDLIAGQRLKMSSVLVETGHGLIEKEKLDFKVRIYKNLYDFAKDLV